MKSQSSLRDAGLDRRFQQGAFRKTPGSTRSVAQTFQAGTRAGGSPVSPPVDPRTNERLIRLAGNSSRPETRERGWAQAGLEFMGARSVAVLVVGC